MIYENQEQLDAGVAKWQKILRLQDWDIKAKISRSSAIGDRDGLSSVVWRLKCNLIQLLDPVDYENQHWPQDHEQRLVHELLHSHFRQILPPDDDEVAEDLWEQVVDQLATAFVNLDRN